jgi:hypothetical protein
MQIVLNNPYRILGLLAGVSAREQQRQTNRLKQFIDAEQEPDDDFSFSILGNLNRTVATVGDAASKLNLESDKINAALFWFVNGNEITDEPAFDALKDSSVLEALNIWSKLIDANDVTNKNYSAFLNLSTYKLNIAFSNVPFVTSALQEGITLKLKFLESDLLSEFVKKIVGITYKPKKEDLQKYFLTQIQFELDKKEQNASDKFLDIITQIEFSGKEDFVKEFSQKPIQQIEKKINDAREQRKANKAAANNIGISLFEETADSLAQLKSTLGLSNSKFVSISDKVSDEILQCGIDYFTYYRETSTDPSSASTSLFRKAKSLAVGSFAKQRCVENTNNLQEWIDEKPEREKQNQIKEYVEHILNILNPSQDFDYTTLLFTKLNEVENIIENCKPSLVSIKNLVGSKDDFYLNISSAVVSRAQSILVEFVNEKVKSCNNPYFGSSSLNTIIIEALDITFILGSFDMLPELENHYSENLSGIKSLAKQLGIPIIKPKERLQREIQLAEIDLREIENKSYFSNEKNSAKSEMNSIKEWQFLRSKSDREYQIQKQQKKINNLFEKAENVKMNDIKKQKQHISNLKVKLYKFKD